MFQLLPIIWGITLLSATVLATINYAPWWWKSAADIEQSVRATMTQLDGAYSAVIRQANGVAPAPDGAKADGGLMDNFGSLIRLPPFAPAGFTWVYGTHPEDGSMHSGLNYFCLRSTMPLNEASHRGIYRAKALYGSSQAVFNDGCGATVDKTRAPKPPASGAMTFYVVYTPGVLQ